MYSRNAAIVLVKFTSGATTTYPINISNGHQCWFTCLPCKLHLQETLCLAFDILKRISNARKPRFLSQHQSTCFQCTKAKRLYVGNPAQLCQHGCTAGGVWHVEHVMTMYRGTSTKPCGLLAWAAIMYKVLPKTVAQHDPGPTSSLGLNLWWQACTESTYMSELSCPNPVIAALGVPDVLLWLWNTS